MKTLKFLASTVLLIFAVLVFSSWSPVAAGVIGAGLIFTAPGGAGVPFQWNMNYLPQFLTWNNVVPLTSLRVETQEDGILDDFLAASIAVINGFMMLGQQAANIVVMRLATGEIKNRNVTISGVTSGAGAIGFFECSDNANKAAYPFKTVNAQIRSLNPTTFTDFTALWVPAMAAGDTAQVEYAAGHRKTYEINDLAALSSFYQETPQIMVNNVNSYIKSVTIQCAADTVAYVMSVKNK